jgi:4'-phosphopantetheinyl transferase
MVDPQGSSTVCKTAAWFFARYMSQTMNITDPGFKIESPLPLPDDEVHLWRVDLESIGADEIRWQQVLSSDELTRAAKFRFSRDRQRFVAARAWLRRILAGYLRTDPRSLTFSYSRKEKPFLGSGFGTSEVSFNVSHSGGIALLAFTRGREIGVDIERLHPDSDLEAISRRFFSAHEQRQLAALPTEAKVDAFFRCWTRKEAYIKATGEGLSLPLDQFDVSVERGTSNALLATRPDDLEAGRWLLREVTGGPGYIAALCVRGQDWKLHDWSEICAH